MVCPTMLANGVAVDVLEYYIHTVKTWLVKFVDIILVYYKFINRTSTTSNTVSTMMLVKGIAVRVLR